MRKRILQVFAGCLRARLATSLKRKAHGRLSVVVSGPTNVRVSVAFHGKARDTAELCAQIARWLAALRVKVTRIDTFREEGTFTVLCPPKVVESTVHRKKRLH